MIRLIMIIFLTLSISGCGNKDQPPSDIIPPKKIQAVLWDLMRADQYLSTYIFKDSITNKTTESLKYYQQIFAIHQLSRDKFKKSFDYYRAHPAVFKMIMDSLSTPTEAAPIQMVSPTVTTVLAHDTLRPAKQ